MTTQPEDSAVEFPLHAAAPGDASAPPCAPGLASPPLLPDGGGEAPDSPARSARRAAEHADLAGSTPGEAAVKAKDPGTRPGRAPYERARPGQDSAYVRGGATLAATASCQRCGWTAGPGPAADVDKAAEKHTKDPPKHPTGTVLEPARRTA